MRQERDITYLRDVCRQLAGTTVIASIRAARGKDSGRQFRKLRDLCFFLEPTIKPKMADMNRTTLARIADFGLGTGDNARKIEGFVQKTPQGALQYEFSNHSSGPRLIRQVAFQTIICAIWDLTDPG